MNKREQKILLKEIRSNEIVMNDIVMKNNEYLIYSMTNNEIYDEFIKTLLTLLVKKKNLKYFIDEEINEDFYKQVFKTNKGSSYRSYVSDINKTNPTNRIIMFSVLNLAQSLIECGINRDLIINKLKDKKDWTLIKSPSLTHIKLLKALYDDARVINLLISKEDHCSVLKEIKRLQKDLATWFSPDEIKEYRVYPKKPKTLKEIHDRLVSKINEKQQFKSVKDFDLNPREDLLKLDGKGIIVNGNDWVVRVAKTKLDLVRFSQSSVFSNCVGTSSTYGVRAKEGKCTIFGIFTQDNKPLYCIETGEYSFNQAMGVGNTSVPIDIYTALEEMLTIQPVLPEDFIEVKHSFIFGYKYDPTNKELYISFRKGSVYKYLEVPNDVYEFFAEQPNKGHNLNTIIKKYKFVR